MAKPTSVSKESDRLIAIVDDEPDICELLSLHLTKAGFRVETFLNGASFYQFLERQVPHLIILDLMLPDVDGLDICRFLKQNPQFAGIPIIMLTARSEEADRVSGLELGADDYVTKPFSPREVVARVRTVLRRHQTPVTEQPITIGGILTIDPQRHEVRVAGEKIALTTTEFRILSILARRPNWVFTRNQILNELWGDQKWVIDRTIDVHISKLRAKLGKAGRLLQNVRGVGYKIET
ncbi:MAG: response regulator transcription factor [candidate division WOR-3 bacterium]